MIRHEHLGTSTWTASSVTKCWKDYAADSMPRSYVSPMYMGGIANTSVANTLMILPHATTGLFSSFIFAFSHFFLQARR